MIWSDKMNYDKAGRQTGHPLTISLGNHPVEFQRTSGGTSIIAMLPRVLPREGESKDSDSFRALKRRVLQAALEVVLKPFKDASQRLLTMRDSTGKHQECRLTLGAFIADLQEQWDALGLRHFRDVSTLATKEDVGNPDSTPALRRESDMQQALRGKPTQKELTELGLTGEEVAFWGFAHTDVYQCVPADTLHQCFNGISLHLVEALKMCIEQSCRSRKDNLFARIRDRMCSYRQLFHGERIPKDSLWAEKTCAEERKAMMRFLGIALHPLDGLPCGLPAFFTAYARYIQLRDMPQHTTGSLALLEELVFQLQEDILRLFGKYKNWASIPKFLHMRKYADDIRRYGMTDLTTTGPKESYNKTLRAAWEFTNKRHSNLQEQVVEKLGVLKPLGPGCEVDSADNARAEVIHSKKHHMGRTGLTLPWQEACDKICTAGGAIASDGAKYLPVCLSNHLKDAWGLHKSQLELCQVTFRRVCYLYFAPYDTVTYVRGGRIAGALFSNNTQPTVCDVSMRSDEDGAWYGRVQLLLSVTHEMKKLDLLYIRWFTAPEEEWNRELNLRPLQWHRRPGAPSESYGCIPLEAVCIERVCIVRIPRQVAGKRGSAGAAGTDARDDEITSQFVLNTLVGPPPEELLPVVPDEIADTVRQEVKELGLCPSQASARLAAVMAAEECKAS
ncbi:hypothetical protein Vretimale_18636 [Volvox reticuliferus]|nr:hypothetical protein Vretimale_18636 [Volvox reticuliferus]